MKSFKKSGLAQHATSHIDTSCSNQIVISLVLKAKDNIISSGVHCQEIIKELQSYSINENSVGRVSDLFELHKDEEY